MSAVISKHPKLRKPLEAGLWLSAVGASCLLALGVYSLAGKPFSTTIGDPLALPKELVVTSGNVDIPLPPELANSIVSNAQAQNADASSDPGTTSNPGTTTTTTNPVAANNNGNVSNPSSTPGSTTPETPAPTTAAPAPTAAPTTSATTPPATNSPGKTDLKPNNTQPSQTPSNPSPSQPTLVINPTDVVNGAGTVVKDVLQ